jgi:uncharacterized membrane protein
MFKALESPLAGVGPTATWPPTRGASHPWRNLVKVCCSTRAPRWATLVMATVWAIGLGYLSVVRHLAGGSHAEDLGFTDQVIWNFLRGQFFRMSVYSGAATWNTELDLSRVLRPDSLLAFHVEPMLLLFVPIYAMGGGAIVLLVVQAVAVAAGAIPAYRLGTYFSNNAWCGVALAATYLLSPFAQWAVLADFHTSTLAAPLLILSLERLFVAHRPVQSIVVAGLAASAREDVGPVLIVLGLVLVLRQGLRRTGIAFVALGLAWTAVALGVIRAYSGGVSPFDVRYGLTFANGPLAAVTRPEVLEYLRTLLLSGGWLGLLAPLSLLPAVPSLALNVLSTSPWMAAGKAHYSGLVLPFVALAAAVALGSLRGRSRLLALACAALLVTSAVGYLAEGAGPLGASFAPAQVTAHARMANALAAALPADTAVSASTSLVPHLTHRAHAYVFPAVQDADYVLLDRYASPAPTSAADVYLRVQSLLASGEWTVDVDTDGLLLLERRPSSDSPASLPAAASTPASITLPPTLVEAALVPGPDGAIDIDGPRWTLRTTWQTDQPLPTGTRLEFWINLNTGGQIHAWDVASLWWNPPDQWPTDQRVTVDVPNVPERSFVSWSATWSTP